MSKGYTNHSPWGISGRTNLRNVIPLHRNYGRHGKSGEFIVTLGDGSKRIYYGKGPDKYQWMLAKEIRPDGNRVFYEYDLNGALRKIWLTDSEEDVPVTSYELTYENRAVYAHGCGQKACYVTDRVNTGLGSQWRLVRMLADHQPETKYRYAEEHVSAFTLGKIIEVTRPEGRRLGIEYYGDGRVSGLYQPSSTDQSLIKVASFRYYNDHCDIIGPCGEALRYCINSERRISHVQRWSNNKLHHQTRYFWEKEGNLIAKALCDAEGQVLTSTCLEYDDRGNVTAEIFYGNLSGTGPSPFTLNENIRPPSKVEGYTIRRTYLPVYNVLEEETCDDGTFTRCQYKEGTNLLISRQTALTNETFSYDKYANLIRTVKETGTTRLITEIEPITTPMRNTKPAIAMTSIAAS